MSMPQQQVRPRPHRSTSSLSLKEKLSAVLSSCRICLSSVFEPACLTSCGHSFCEGCLNTYWHVNNKPEYIICPLCRGQASGITFVQKNNASSNKDFRETFNVDVNETKSFISINPSRLCLKMMLIPAFYWIFSWIQGPLIQLVNDFRVAKLE